VSENSLSNKEEIPFTFKKTGEILKEKTK